MAAAPGTAPTLTYRVLRSAARRTLGLFYRHIEVTGIEHLQAGVATILASTHPNSIIDPLLVGLFETRQVTFCARDGLFRVPLFGSLMRAVGAVPIRRSSDHAGPIDNSQTFAACREVLAAGGVISIFPEGKTHARMRVEPLKTGAARMAIDAVEAGELRELHIVPVGLNYLVREAFRSDVHVAFGAPISVPTLLAELDAADPSSSERPRERVRALTARVGQAMRELAIHIEREEDERLIAQVTQIIVDIRRAEGLDSHGQSPAERTALVQRVVDAYRGLEQRAPIYCARLRARLVDYLEERRSLGLATGGVETALQQRRERRHGREDRSFLGPVALLLGAPFALAGLAAATPPYAILRLLLLIGRPSPYRVALTKLLGGAALFGAWYSALSLAAMSYMRPSFALALGLALVPLTIFAHRYLIDLRLYRFGLRRNLRKLGQRTRHVQLNAERRLLELELGAVRRAYLAEHPDSETA